MYKKNKTKWFKITSILLVPTLLLSVWYIYSSSAFERVQPKIESQNNLVWNRIDTMQIQISDNEGLKSFQLSLNDGKNEFIVGEGIFKDNPKTKTLTLNYPKNTTIDKNTKKLTLKVIVTDSSLWDFSNGNKNEEVIDIIVDSTRPNINILSNSYSITQGGSALVVFKAEDENLDALYIQAGGKKFLPQPYKIEGYYAALIAWPFTSKSFDAKIVATDLAKNTHSKEISFYMKNHEYKKSWIEAKDKFIDGKITELASLDQEYVNVKDRLKKLVAVNETMRLKNEALIHKLTKEVSSEILEGWKINKFYPLKNGQRVASYGDERHYYYKTKENEVSHSYHVGYDLASTRMAAIKASNSGTVVYTGENGIYGNMPIINHGLGLHSLYGHCSKVLVKDGDQVETGDIIASTGSSGLALGDHLHFGLLVQGVEVRPVEWFDQDWIRKHIEDVFNAADVIIKDQL